MRASDGSWTRRERVMMAACGGSMAISVIALLCLGGAVSVAGAGDQVTAADIAKGAVRASEVKNGSLQATDLGIYTVQGDFVTVNAGGSRTAFAGCNAGDQVLSGGGVLIGNQQGIQLIGSQPGFDNAGNDAWAATASNYSATNVGFFAQAICMND